LIYPSILARRTDDQALITTLLPIGGDHILFASDTPYDMSTDAARWIERAPISENDRRKICYDNAAAVFGLSFRSS
jgi:predicted TIM-barrel fold metal-dependent hydrolase